MHNYASIIRMTCKYCYTIHSKRSAVGEGDEWVYILCGSYNRKRKSLKSIKEDLKTLLTKS